MTNTVVTTSTPLSSVELTIDSVGVIHTDLSQGNGVFYFTLSENATLSRPGNMDNASTYFWIITQADDFTLDYDAVFKWPAGTPPTITATPGAVDVISAVSLGGVLYAAITQDFS